ncbi:hypothetical protein TSACC_21162 [Terrimicrobium sacchariphilum]|uniref:Uncharacterized protein n=1 Tax=Terrimicrobium sacchariphilum TaxID=690879 RepID=A0A146G5E0_TERSA|nr:hypothetical protein [Terrimicrobium sacchariphilum]GAT32761.1 hypothetical protein TSACC_21162 [Terrimicrobium sacchariphilum]
MKSPLITLTIVLLAATAPLRAESKHTAEYFLTTPQDFVNQIVSLDVAFVKPVHWVSPNPDFQFFHAMTIDRTDKKPGGGILVAVKAADASAFARKYGTDFDGKNDSTILKGLFLAGGGEKGRMKIYLVDTTGELKALFDAGEFALPAEPADGGEQSGPRPHKGPQQ